MTPSAALQVITALFVVASPFSQACNLLSRLIGMIADCCITLFTFPLVIYLFL
jgi:hypothetical protein